MTDSTQSESLLIKKIRHGNEYAFEITFLKYYEPMCLCVWKYVRSKELSKEIVQDVFADIWENRNNLDPEGHLRGLLFVAARNKALDYLKHQKVVQNYRQETRKIKQNQFYTNIYPSDPVSASLVNEIGEAINALPPKARKVFLLNREEGLTYVEIADHLSISVKTVESQISRVLKLLRRHLSQYLPIFLILCCWFLQ